jgi:hypothetical protein
MPGGDFAFMEKDARGKETESVVQPRFGRLSCFTSGGENPHRVRQVCSIGKVCFFCRSKIKLRQVTGGTRYALTIAFSCDPKSEIPLLLSKK